MKRPTPGRAAKSASNNGASSHRRGVGTSKADRPSNPSRFAHLAGQHATVVQHLSSAVASRTTIPPLPLDTAGAAADFILRAHAKARCGDRVHSDRLAASTSQPWAIARSETMNVLAAEGCRMAATMTPDQASNFCLGAYSKARGIKGA